MQFIELPNGDVKIKESYDIPVANKIKSTYVDEDHLTVNLTVELPEVLAISYLEYPFS